MSKPVAKSLHTLTVVQQVAAVLIDLGRFNDAESAIDGAMARLGLSNRPDPYGLRDRALALFNR